MLNSYVQNTKKLDARSTKGYFVGYDKESPSYLIYYPENNSVMKHRVVKFTDKFEVRKSFVEESNLFDSNYYKSPPVKQESEEIVLNGLENKSPSVKNEGEEIVSSGLEEESSRRYPLRNRKPPNYSANYVCDTENEDFINNVDFCYALNVPSSFEEAMKSDDKLKWQIAMDAEIKSLEVNNTFTLTKLPEDKKLVGGRWVYDIKGKPENPIYKARYVAKGYSQVYGSDYFETFSPTPRMESIRVLM